MIHYTNLSPYGYREQMNNPDARLIHDQRVHDLMEFEKRYKDVYDFKFHLPTDRQELLVLTKGLLDWDKKLHDELCNELGYKLYCFERNEIYIHGDYEKSLCLTYIPESIFEFENIEPLKWEEFSLDEVSSLNYNDVLVHWADCKHMVRWEEGDHCTKYDYNFLDFEGYEDVCPECDSFELR